MTRQVVKYERGFVGRIFQVIFWLANIVMGILFFTSLPQMTVIGFPFWMVSWVGVAALTGIPMLLTRRKVILTEEA